MKKHKKTKVEESITLTKFKEIIQNKERLLLERLRYDRENGASEILEELEDLIDNDENVSAHEENCIYQYLRELGKMENKYYFDEFIDEVIDRLHDPKPKKGDIIARRLIFDYMNLSDIGEESLSAATDYLTTVKDQKVIEKYLDAFDNDESPDCGCLGDILVKLLKKHPLYK